MDKVLTVPELQRIGVKRISVGPMLHANAMGVLEHTTTALVAGDLAAATTGMSFECVDELLARGKNWPDPTKHRSSPTHRKELDAGLTDRPPSAPALTSPPRPPTADRPINRTAIR